MSITRVADITKLDVIAIPTYQAVRPNGRNLSVSQGKGLTSAEAKASAVMESIETWHAETIEPPSVVASIEEIRSDLGYDPHLLCMYGKSLLTDSGRLGWLEGRTLDGARTALVPYDHVTLDARVRFEWGAPIFRSSGNGLASGNTKEEALLHALYELIERDGLARLGSLPRADQMRVDPSSIMDGGGAWLMQRLMNAGQGIEIFDATGPTGIPCFKAVIRSADYPRGFLGSGCHLDPDIALCRALTEAAQSRLTRISGARDDMDDDVYGRFRFGSSSDHGSGGGSSFPPGGRLRTFRSFKSLAAETLEEDLALVVRLVEHQTGVPPMEVDLTKPHVSVPVVKAVAPGLYDEDFGTLALRAAALRS